MARVVDIHEAQTNFSKLVDEVENGGEVTVARAGKPILKLVKLVDTPVQRKLGQFSRKNENFDWDAWDSLDRELAGTWNANKLDEI